MLGKYRDPGKNKGDCFITIPCLSFSCLGPHLPTTSSVDDKEFCCQASRQIHILENRSEAEDGEILGRLESHYQSQLASLRSFLDSVTSERDQERLAWDLERKQLGFLAQKYQRENMRLLEKVRDPICDYVWTSLFLRKFAAVGWCDIVREKD